MGGTAIKQKFGIETKRVSTNEFHIIWNELKPMLESLFPKSEIEYVKYYHTKETHGDMDILIRNNGTLGNVTEKIETISKYIATNSNVYSFEYKLFQIDLILITERYWESREFFHYDPTGNIMGKISRILGTNLGISGLQYVYRIKNSKHFINLTQNFNEICNFLDLDYSKYNSGFENIIEIFEWCLNSKYINIDKFKFENFNHADRKRNRRRKSYHDFLEYIEQNNIKNKFELKKDKKEYFDYIDSTFPNANFKEEIAKYDALNERTITLSNRFNGRIVMLLTGLKDKELEQFIRDFRKKYSDDWILNNPPYKIDSAIVNFNK